MEGVEREREGGGYKFLSGTGNSENPHVGNAVICYYHMYPTTHCMPGVEGYVCVLQLVQLQVVLLLSTNPRNQLLEVGSAYNQWESFPSSFTTLSLSHTHSLSLYLSLSDKQLFYSIMATAHLKYFVVSSIFPPV